MQSNLPDKACNFSYYLFWQVRFEDALDAEAKGDMGKIRKKLQKEKKVQDRKKQVIIICDRSH